MYNKLKNYLPLLPKKRAGKLPALLLTIKWLIPKECIKCH